MSGNKKSHEDSCKTQKECEYGSFEVNKCNWNGPLSTEIDLDLQSDWISPHLNKPRDNLGFKAVDGKENRKHYGKMQHKVLHKCVIGPLQPLSPRLRGSKRKIWQGGINHLQLQHVCPCSLCRLSGSVVSRRELICSKQPGVFSPRLVRQAVHHRRRRLASA